MPPQLALYACYGFIAFLIRKDMVWRKAGSWALLIPGIWIALRGSRSLSYWLNPGGSDGSEASPVDTITFAALILAAVVILSKRGVSLGAIFRDNKAVLLIYLYFLASIVWSESPVDSLKRLIKDFGCVPIAMLFLTEINPAVAVRAVYFRVACILFPLSYVFGKYYPDIGRAFTRAGEPMFTGVTSQKNSLGETVFVFGLMILWDLVRVCQEGGWAKQKWPVAVRAGILGLGLWLLIMCDSQTSLLCLMLGTATFFGCRWLTRLRHGKRILIAILTTGICLAALDKTFGISQAVAVAMGRNPDLTGRTGIWDAVMEQKTNPLLGSGFCIFWDTDKGKAVIEALMRINSAHNGYLEMYLDGGIVADVLIGLLLLVGGRKIINGVFSGAPFGVIGMAFWVTALVYNLSESSFFRLDPLWFTALLVMLQSPFGQLEPAVVADRESNPEMAGESGFQGAS